MLGKDALFKIVDKQSFPLPYGLCHKFFNIGFRNTRCHPCISRRRRHRHIWLDNNHCVASQIHIHRFEQIADAASCHRPVVGKKRAVGAETLHADGDFLFTEPQRKHRVENFGYRRGVRRAAAESCPVWNMLIQMYRHRRQFKLFLHQAVGLHHKIFFRRTVHRIAIGEQRGFFCLDHLDGVGQRYRIKHRRQVVVSVFTLTLHIQAQIYFCIRKCYHRYFLFFVQKSTYRCATFL